MQKTTIIKEHHMKCDICGKEQTYPESQFMTFNCLDYGWSVLRWTRSIFVFGVRRSEYHLCPDCTKNFDNKVVKEIVLEEPGPICK